MYQWKTVVEPTSRSTKLLVMDPDGHELMKAMLPPVPQHPRALLTLLEGLALWAGHPLTVVISAGSALPRHIGEALFGAGPLPCDSALVSFEVIDRLSRRRTLVCSVG